jgi:hypothetical protein
MNGKLTRFVPRTAGTFPNMYSGERDCDDTGASAIVCTPMVRLSQRVETVVSALAGEIFEDGSETPNAIHATNPTGQYDDPSDLTLVEGDWVRSTAGNASINVMANGAYTGMDTGGSTCAYSGNISIIDATKNAYRMTMTVTGCGDFNGDDYTGLAWIGEAWMGGGRSGPPTYGGTFFFFHVDNGDFVIADQLERP